MPLSLTLFSDFSCPYSYLTETALRAMGLEEVEIEYRAFELYPEPEPLEAVAIREDERATLERLAEFQGIELREGMDRPRTRKAHEASAFARERGVEGEFRERVFAAYWRAARDIGRIDVLMEVGSEVGLDPQELKIALDIDRFRDQVLRDRDLARRLRVPGTPTLFVGRGAAARVFAGAQSPAVLRTVIEEVIRDLNVPTDDV